MKNNKRGWFAIAVLVSLVFGPVSPILTEPAFAKTVTVIPSSAADLAAANGMEILSPGFVAVAGEATASKDKNKNSEDTNIILKDGQQLAVPSSGPQTIVQAADGVTTFVRSGSGVAVYGTTTTKADSSAVVAPEVTAGLAHTSGTIPVIIHLAGEGHFYDKADNKTRFNSKKNQLQSLLSGKAKIKKELPIIYALAVDLDTESLSRLATHPLVARIEPDTIAHTTLDTSVDEIHASEVWGLSDPENNSLTGIGQTIAVIDTGVDYTHPDLGGCLGQNCKVISGYDFVLNVNNPMDDNGHGTHVAATAAGNGLLKGVAPDAKILAYKVCNSGGACFSSHIIAALDYAVDPNRDGNPSDHVAVATLSIGGSGNPDDSMSMAVDSATAAGVVVTVAAGNSGPGDATINSPGTARTAITVAAACKTSQIGSVCSSPIAQFSSRGPLIWNGQDIQKPDIAAPGMLICAARWALSFGNAPTCFDSAHVRISGTSMATPHVAGAAALVRQAFPNFSPAEVKQVLKTNATSLGVAYKDQGAGKINVKAAIPNNQNISAVPATWSPISDPTIKISSSSQNVTITPLNTITGLDIGFNLTVPGVTLSADKTTLDFTSQPNDTFTVTITIDNDVAASGSYGGSIVLSEGGTTKGVIPVFVTVKPGIGVSVAAVDYGLDNPGLPQWTSDVKQITINNFRTDISQTISLNAVVPDGLTFNGPTSVSILPGGSATIDTSLSADNSQLPNGTHTGTLTLTGGTQNLVVSLKCMKFFALTVTDNSTGDLANATIFVHNHSTEQYIFVATGSPSTIYLNAASPYDVMVLFAPLTDSTGIHQHTVIREGLDLSTGTLSTAVTRADAIHKVRMIGTDKDGNTLTTLGQYDFATIYAPKQTIGVTASFRPVEIGATATNDNYFSDISTNYVHQDLYGSPKSQPANDLYFLHGGFTGLSGDLTYTNTPASLKTVDVQQDINIDSGNILPFFYRCFAPPVNGICNASYRNAEFLPLPVVQHIYSTLPAGTFLYQTSNQNKTGCSGSGACDTVAFLPLFDPATGARKTTFGSGTNLPSFAGTTLYAGLGPSVWQLKFNNTANQVVFKPYAGGPNAAFTRQDFSLQQYNAVSYAVTQNASPASTGTLPAFLPEYPLYTGSSFSPISVLTPGSYAFNTSFPYKIKGNPFTAQVTAEFNTVLADPNPPAIKRLYYYTAGARSEVHDSATDNTLEFELDPIGGTLTQVTAAIHIDGGNDIPLTVSETSGIYSTSVPGVSGEKISLKISGVDDSGNRLDYTFELPVINPIDPVPDTIVPTVNLTAPVTGNDIAGGMVITADATDNSGVTKVEFYRDTTLLNEDTTAPYSYTWDTTTATDGDYTLSAKAYDAAGNVGTSTNVAIGVDNTVPSGTITAPLDGASVSDTVDLSATASDNRTVAKVEFYVDSTLIATKTGAPYTTPWDSSTVNNGNHTVVVKIYDAAGNVFTAPTHTVSVSNDTAVPTVALTTPLAGATVSDTVSITVDASDDIGIDHVDFYLDTTLIGTDTSAPYSLNWDSTTVANGSYAITAKAYDTAGKNATSVAVTITVSNQVIPPPDTTAPTVSITAPVSGATLQGTVSVTATASDDTGVTKVEFYRDEILLDTDTVAPYTFSWDTTTETVGAHTLLAKAYDAANNIGQSTPVSVTVADQILPVTSISSPLNNANVTKGTTVAISATASDNVGVTKVEFYVNNILKCTDTATAYSCSWSVPKPKNVTYALQTKSYDAAGNSGVSSIVSVVAR